MKLYHGTSARYLNRISREGLKPRGKKGNWDHSVLSNPNAVYLTVAYSLYYAWCATKGDDDALILEINSNMLNTFALCPDEDFMEQATRKHPDYQDVTGTYLERTVYFRDHLEDDLAGTDMWEKSIKHMGNCCYFGQVPVDAITRVAVISNPVSWVRWSDPTICLENFMFMGSYYKALSASLFGDTHDYQPHNDGYGELPPPEQFAKVRVQKLKVETA